MMHSNSRGHVMAAQAKVLRTPIVSATHDYNRKPTREV